MRFGVCGFFEVFVFRFVFGDEIGGGVVFG